MTSASSTQECNPPILEINKFGDIEARGCSSKANYFEVVLLLLL